MTTLTCPKCNSQLDLSGMPPGHQFTCGGCGTVLQVPGAAAPRRPAAPQRRPAAAPQRPTPPPGPRGRRPSRAGRSRRDDGPPPARSRLPLVLGGVGAGVILLVIVLIVVLGGDPADETPVVVKPEGPSKVEQIRKLARKVDFAAKDVVRLRQLAEEAKALGANDLYVHAARLAHATDPMDDWANGVLGNVRFDSSGLPDEEEILYPTKDWDVLVEAAEQVWLTPEEAEHFAAVKERFLTHLRQLESDGHYRRVWQTRTGVGLHPVFKDFTYDTEDKRPYLIFLESTDDPKKAAKVREIAERKGRVYLWLYKTFMETLGEELKLTKLESDDYDKDVILRAWICKDRKTFGELNTLLLGSNPGGIGAYYLPADQWMVIPVGGMSYPGLNLRGQDMDVNVSLHEGLHQLVHHFAKKTIETETGKDLSWTDQRLDSDAMWFQEGVAEWFGSALPKDDAWVPFQMNWYRLTAWKMYRARKADEWEFDELLAAGSNADLRVGKARHMSGLFYGQAWAFVHFLWNFEDGKYRAQFLEYFRGELRGKSGMREFRRIFKVEKVKGSQIEKEFEAYCDELLEKA